MPSIQKSLSAITLIRVFAVSFLFMVITHPGLWVAFANGYSEDYLFNLSTGQIIGLVVITTALLVLLFLVCSFASFFLCQWFGHLIPRWLLVLSCSVLGFILCAAGLFLVPQLHYQYYRWIIPGLPAQWVPFGELSSTQIWQYFLLSSDGNTTDHAKGGSIWICDFARALIAFKTSQPESGAQ